MKIELGVTESQLIEEVTNAVRARVAESIGDSWSVFVERMAEEAVQTRLRELTDDALRQAFEGVLRDGWKVTDTYGRETGKTKTVKDWVLEYMTRDSYHSPADRIFREAIDRELKNEMGELLKDAKAKLRGLLDEKVQSQLRGVLTEAVRS